MSLNQILFVSFIYFSVLTTLSTSIPFNFNLSQNSIHSPFDKCGYEFCPKGDPNKINVHLVSHTHDDVGWLKTVDQYFYGQKSGVQRAGVQYILDTVIPQLLEDPKKKFIYVETAFFWKWWQKQSNNMQMVVYELVQNGRLEFIGGGWSMNDEGAVHYNSLIDQMTWGHRKLFDAFGKCGVPRVAWQIDPFGHSREQAALFAKMFFDGLFFGRLDYNDKTKREIDKTMEFIWKGSDDLGPQCDLFTGVLPNGYNPPEGFCFDDTCADEPIIDDPDSEEYNVKERVDAFITATKKQALSYATNHLIMTMGSDFQYQNALTWFKNLDKLINHVNARQRDGGDINVFYSSPSCYLYALNNANRTWTTKSDDFFPYASDPHAYWTGYFTSRPAFKLFERRANNFLQTCKQLQSLGRINDDQTEAEVTSLREAMGISQHHDAVSGTEKQHVANDYALQLTRGIAECEKVVNKAYTKLLPIDSNTPPTPQYFCQSLNISECSSTETMAKIAVTVYNPTAHERKAKVRLPWVGSAYSVVDFAKKPVKAELLALPDYVKAIPGRKSNATGELVFEAQLPPLGFATYFVEKTPGKGSPPVIPPLVGPRSRPGGDVEFKAKTFSVLFDCNNGQAKEIKLSGGSSFPFTQDFRWYKAMKGDNKKFDHRASGAYIFRPNGTLSNELKLTSSIATARFTFGRTVNEVHQKWSPWLSQTIRVYTEEDYIEMDWVVGPIPVEDLEGKEIISHFQTNFATDKVFYTDANGRQMLKRVRDFRPTWRYNNTEPVSGNYYPVNSRICIRDEKAGLQLTVLTDRSQGGSSIQDGAVELMVHRRLLHDDAFGVDEALNETGVDGKGLVIRGQHYVIPSTIAEAGKHRDLGLKQYMQPILTFAGYSDIDAYGKDYETFYSGLNRALPPNVHLLTLEEWKDKTLLLRLEHFYDSQDDPGNLSKPARVSLRGLFKPFTIVAAIETTLSSNQLLAEAERLQWKTLDDWKTSPIKDKFSSLKLTDFAVTLKPMAIRTLMIVVRRPD